MLDTEIRAQLEKYLGGTLSLPQFQEWFAVSTWDIDQSDNTQLKELAYKIELALAEYLSGHLPEAELKNELSPLIRSLTAGLTN